MTFKQPERSVEEIAEEVYLKIVTRAGIPVEHIAEALQAERQKREEVVEAERARLLRMVLTEFGDCPINNPEADAGYAQFRSDLVKKLTQPNNPK